MRSRLTRHVSPLMAVLAVGALVAAPVFAASVSTSSMTVLVGGTATRAVSSIVTPLPADYLTSSNTAVATASWKASTSTSGTITVTGVSDGSSTVTFKDKKGTYRFTVTVKKPMVVTPSLLTLDVLKAGSFAIANANSTNITVSPSGTTYFKTAITTPTNIIVTATSATTGTNVPVVISDGLTKATVYVRVTRGTLPTLTGRLEASNCYQCHGTSAMGGFAGLTGKSQSEIYVKLKEYQAKSVGGDIMAAHVAGLTDRQLQDIAAWIDTLH